MKFHIHMQPLLTPSGRSLQQQFLGHSSQPKFLGHSSQQQFFGHSLQQEFLSHLLRWAIPWTFKVTAKLNRKMTRVIYFIYFVYVILKCTLAFLYLQNYYSLIIMSNNFFKTAWKLSWTELFPSKQMDSMQ